MTDIESLRRLTEAVETAGADIAPTYAEYVQLAFAIATDCGEAGREFFHRLCRTSAKYQREHAERIFSNALTTRHGEVHLGTAFHLAEMANVKLCNTEVMNNRRNTENTENTPPKVLTHAHVYNKVENDEPDESEELLNGSDPNQPLPTFPEADWPKILLLIMSYATSPTQRDVMLIGALTAIGASMERYVRCPYAGKLQSPCLQSFIVAPSASGKGILSLIRLLVEPIHDEIRQQVATEVKAYKKEKANANPDMNAYDVIYYAGDCNAGSKNIAINLPNDPRVHAAKGSRKLQLKNSMQAKFDKMVVPIARLVIDPEQQKHIRFDAFFENTMFHEVAHGLGVKYTLQGNQDVRGALKDNYTSIEEGKADILGLFCITKLAEWGVIQNKDLMDNYVTFIAGIFRSCRFGAASAHGKANMMQFAHFIESGAITRDADKGYYTIDFEKMKKDIEIIAGEYITLEGDGDYDKASQLIAAKGIVSPILQKDLDRIAQAGIPKDIYFQQGLQTLGL